MNRYVSAGGRGVLLSAVHFSTTSDCVAGQAQPQCGTPELYVYKLKLGSNASSDTLPAFVSTVNSVSSPFTLAGVDVADMRQPYVAQTQEPGLLPIWLEDLETDNGDVIENYNSCSGGNGCHNFFATSFTAVAPDATMSNGVYTSGDSYYVPFVLNLYNGTSHTFVQPFLNAITSYSNAVIDSDDELWVNYTVFPFGFPPSVNEDEYDYYPLNSPPGYLNSYAVVDSAQPAAAECDSTRCRWGDYVAQTIDPSCDAFNAGDSPECGLAWNTSEYVYTPTQDVSFGSGVPDCPAGDECQASQVTAFHDSNTPDETDDITFVGYSNTESECPGGGKCYLSITPPAGVQQGDVLLVAMEAASATQYVPNLPYGWNALPFQNQGGSQNFNSYDIAGNKETGWLLTHVYGSAGAEPGQYWFSEPLVSPGELTGLMLAYRGVGTPDAASFLAKGNGATASDNTTVTTGKMTAVADEKLVTVFGDGGDECGPEFSGNIYFTTPTPGGLYVATPLTVSGDVLAGFAAQAGTGGGGTFGPYSSTLTAPACGNNLYGIPLAWMVLLPSE